MIFAWRGGVIDCVRLINVLTLKEHLSADTSLGVWHKGYTTAYLSLGKLARYQTNSDTVLVQFLDPNTFPIQEAKFKHIVFAHKAILRSKDVLLISDCQHAELIYWNNIHLTNSYQMDDGLACLIKLFTTLADTRRLNEVGEHIYALYSV